MSFENRSDPPVTMGAPAFYVLEKRAGLGFRRDRPMVKAIG